MTKIMILKENPDSPHPTYRASSGDHESVGQTAGAALDALTEQLDPAQAGTLVVVQDLAPDAFFTAAQQHRLSNLLTKQREATDAGKPMLPADRAELQALIDAELDGATQRAAAVVRGRKA